MYANIKYIGPGGSCQRFFARVKLMTSWMCLIVKYVIIH